MVWQDSDHTVHVNLWLPEKLPRRVLRAYRRLLTEMTNFINGHFAGRAAPVRIRLLDGPAVPPIFPPGVGVQVDTPPRLE